MAPLVSTGFTVFPEIELVEVAAPETSFASPESALVDMPSNVTLPIVPAAGSLPWASSARGGCVLTSLVVVQVP